MQDNAAKIPTTYIGIIEGFFGREWSWEARKRYAAFCAQRGLNFYIYAPKGDKHLRSLWQRDWPSVQKQSLIDLRQGYADTGVDFGVGLSPHEIYLNNTKENQKAFCERIRSINQLEPEILCILFDDMRGDLPELANLQVDLIHQAADISTAKKIIACPTYYSLDPVLEKVFGKMPEEYWQTLGKKLDGTIDLFWTGEKVCSPEYSIDHIKIATELLNRKPFLWDNYPVNDGAAKSKHLYLQAVPDSHAHLQGMVSGHACNPMNQAALSEFALASLSKAYFEPSTYNQDQATEQIIKTLCGDPLTNQLLQDHKLFAAQGLDNIESTAKTALINTYTKYLPNPYAAEVIDWLTDGYKFDPSCLTG